MANVLTRLDKMRLILAALPEGSPAKDIMAADIAAREKAENDRRDLRQKLGFTNILPDGTEEVLHVGDTLYEPGNVSIRFEIDPKTMEQYVYLDVAVKTHTVRAIGQKAVAEGGHYGNTTVGDYFGFTVLPSGRIPANDQLTKINASKDREQAAELTFAKIGDNRHRAAMIQAACDQADEEVRKNPNATSWQVKLTSAVEAT